VSKHILVIMHTELVPPADAKEKDIDRYATPWLTEFDVIKQLEKMGHRVSTLGLYDDLNPLLKIIQEDKPDLVYNLLEEFNGNTQMDYHIVALLEAMSIPVTGCNSKGLVLARDKALAKKILKHHHIVTPSFFTFEKNKKSKIPKNTKYPLIVKCLFEEASFGIAQASIVNTEEKLLERIQYIHEKLKQDAIIEEFIEGVECYVGVLGHQRLQTLPVWQLHFDKAKNPGKEIYSSSAKWNENYRKRKGIDTGPAKFDKPTTEKIIKACKRAYKALNLSGYARIDFRVTDTGQVYVLEANPNPNIASDDEFAKSAQSHGISYEDLLKKIIAIT